MRKVPFSIVAVAFAFLVCSSAWAQFEQANREYAAGDYKSAIAHYEELVQKQEYSANLFYNLGNAYFRNHDLGRAILSYERALALEPHHPEAEANLRVAREQARALELPRGTNGRLIGTLTLAQYSMTAAVAFWIGAFAIAFAIFSPGRRRFRIGLAMIAMAVTAGTAFVALEKAGAARTLGIIVANEVQARVATADSAHSVLMLPPGSEVKVLRTRGDWTYGSLPNDLVGWVPAKAVEPVSLN